MKNKITFLFLLNSILLLAQQGAPATYYNGFNWNQTGTSLKNALSTKIISTHSKLLSYQQAEYAIQVVDLDPLDTSNTNVLLVYGFSPSICPSSVADDNDHRRRNKDSDGGGATCQWNREHTYAKSLGTPNLGTAGAGADAHHLRAADVQRNSDRGSKKFSAGSGNSQSLGATWYPGDEWKGDIARMMMYMYLRYGNQCLPKNVASGTVNALDSNMINLLLQWNAQDPVSTYEDTRNTYLGNANNAYGQGNRNPFIDNPYLATLIWGGQVAENRWPNVYLTAPIFDLNDDLVVYPNPTNNHRISIATEIKLDEIQLININGQIMQQIKNPAVINNSYSVENIPQGFYILRITADDQTVVKKVIVN
ncbi:endonuclease [Flavobacterium antarcticum]|uniref:endonuclease n=1 Tax=Flavobacterium antarcticum TaxID=271155 RepID=UPI0003B5F2D3|nr:endonuclease [Flavobacterium antarcticum]